METIVVAMMENPSCDTRLGMGHRRGADGFQLGRNGLPTATNPYPNRDLQHAFHMPTTCQPSGVPSQEWKASHIPFANGRNDAFVNSLTRPPSIAYQTPAPHPLSAPLPYLF